MSINPARLRPPPNILAAGMAAASLPGRGGSVTPLSGCYQDETANARRGPAAQRSSGGRWLSPWAAKMAAIRPSCSPAAMASSTA